MSYNTDISSKEDYYKMLMTPSNDDYKMKITAMVYPQDISNPTITWTNSDPECFELLPDESDPNVMWGRILKAKAGGVQITAECYGVTATTTVYLIDG